ncbi:lipoprotein LpqH [Actinomyces sp.]|uniref:lipoprotein LpqH n=1 Tax=Actinomyces sp. TaxID=29317 RepID=UPI0026DD30D5|nr:lipoprotein LpqH [Actinomyces sp.]MDO4901400.1 lipoprotein LpqH [Actinomyces sp.]
MNTPLLKTLTTSAILVFALGLGACGSNDTNGAEQSASTAGADSATEAGAGTGSKTDTGEGASSSVDGVRVGGSFSGTLNGEPFEIENGVVSCLSQDGKTSIGVASTDTSLAGEGVRSIALAVDDASQEIQLITIVPGDGGSLNYTKIGDYSSDVGNAQVEVNDLTYIVTGEAAPSGSTETKSFNFTITCP